MNPDEESRRFLWQFSPNINQLPNSVRNNAIQHHVGQVMRGVLPGSGPQPQYHPNPFLQHLYDRQESRENEENTQENNQHETLVDMEHVEAELQQAIDSLADAQNLRHGHSRVNGRRPLTENFDWKVLLGSVSFGLILFLRLMADHILGLLMFIGLSAVFYYSNMKMIEIVHITSLRDRHEGKSVVCTCIWLIMFLTANVAAIYTIFDDQHLYRVPLVQIFITLMAAQYVNLERLYFNLPSDWQGSLFDLFWVTMVTDHIMRFGTIALKCILSLLPQLFLLQKKKGKYYMFIETLSQAYRTCLPAVPWVHYLYDQPKSWRHAFAAILVVVYVILKIYSLYKELGKLQKAFKTLRADTKYGVQPTAEELKSRDSECPICQSDYQDPVMLSCKHIFCENCVSIWFDREKTCPMCRAEIQTESPVWQDGSTSAHLQWY